MLAERIIPANDAPDTIDSIGAIAPVVAAAPAAAPALVAEVLADALSGGADPSVSIDHLLSSLPVADAKVALVAQLGADFSADALTLSGATHLPSVFGMETFTVQHDSVAVHA